MKIRFTLWPLVMGLSGFALPATEPIAPLTLAAQMAGNFQTDRRNYLQPLLTLRQHRSNYLGSPEQAGQYWQAMATYASLAGEIDSATFAWYHQPGSGIVPPAETRPPGEPALVALPAPAALLAQTSRRRLVLFNEDHIQPKGRWLLGSLLPALRQQGFRYLALEALSGADTAGVRQRGYPLANSGFYTNEPHFANLIRLARTLGFHIIAYDAMSANREEAQARNLLAATLAQDSTARVVVLAGHGHIDEQPDAATKSMAQWLHQLSGIDPLTIDQTQLVRVPEAFRPSLRSAAWVVPNARLFLHPGALQTDIYVLNNLPIGASNTFGQRTGRLVTIPLPRRVRSLGQPQILLIYRQQEQHGVTNPVPVVVHCLKEVEKALPVTLLPDSYTVEIRDGVGHANWQRSLSVR